VFSRRVELLFGKIGQPLPIVVFMGGFHLRDPAIDLLPRLLRVEAVFHSPFLDLAAKVQRGGSTLFPSFLLRAFGGVAEELFDTVVRPEELRSHLEKLDGDDVAEEVSTETEVAETEAESAESEVVEADAAETDATPAEETETADPAATEEKEEE